MKRSITTRKLRCLFHFYGNIAKEFQVLIIVLQAWQRLMKNDTKKCWVWKHLNKILSNKTLYVASTIRGTSKVELRFKPCAYYHTIVLMIFHGFFCNALSYSMQRYIQHSIHKCHHDIFVHCWILYYMTHQGAPSHTHSGKLNMFFYVWNLKWFPNNTTKSCNEITKAINGDSKVIRLLVHCVHDSSLVLYLQWP